MLEVASSYTRAASVVFPSTQNLPPDLMSRGLPPDFSGRPQPLRSLKFHTLTYTLHLLMISDVELVYINLHLKSLNTSLFKMDRDLK